MIMSNLARSPPRGTTASRSSALLAVSRPAWARVKRGHGAEERVLAGDLGIGAGHGDDERDAEAAGDDGADKAVGQDPVGVEHGRAQAAGVGQDAGDAGGEESRAEQVGFEAQGEIRLHRAHVAELVQARGPGIAIEAEGDGGRDTNYRVRTGEGAGVGGVVGRPDGDLLLLVGEFIAEGFDEGAAEVACEARVVVGENADVHGSVLYQKCRSQAPLGSLA